MSNTSEIGYPSRTKWVVAVIVLIALPSLVLSEWSLEKIQAKFVHEAAQAGKPWASDVQKWIAHGYGYTLRPKRAAERYGWAADLYARQGNYDEAGWCYFNKAVELEASNDKWTAKGIYEQVESDYKEYPVGAKAHGALVRLNTMSRP